MSMAAAFGSSSSRVEKNQPVQSGAEKAIPVTSRKHRFSSSARLSLVFGLLLALATAAVYFPAISHPFCNYDDSVYVIANPHVQSGLTWEMVKWAFSSFDAANWHPVTWLSHALDCQLFYLDPAGHHGVNVALHVINALLLFWVLSVATGFVGRSAMVAALFALHPINVESVAWVAERKNLLSMTFFLLALAAYRWYAQKPGAGRYAGCTLLFVLGLMSKPQVVTFPLVLLLWDYWPLRRSFAATLEPLPGFVTPAPIPRATFSWLILEKLPLVALSAISAVITLKAQHAGGALPMIRIPLGMRMANAAIAYTRYLEKAIWPSRLAVFYPHPLGAAVGWPAVAAGILLLMVTVSVVLWRERRYLLVGWLWFLGTLVPMIGVVQVGTQAMADRYAYLPFVGLYLMICWGVADFAQERHLPKAALPAASFAALLALAIVTYRQIGYWKDDVTLWSHAVQVTNGNYLAEDNLGEALVDQGKMDEAMPHFFRAASIFPADPTSNLNIGAYEQSQQNYASAIAQYEQVLRHTMNPIVRRKALVNMADAYNAVGDPAKARECLRAAESLPNP